MQRESGFIGKTLKCVLAKHPISCYPDSKLVCPEEFKHVNTRVKNEVTETTVFKPDWMQTVGSTNDKDLQWLWCDWMKCTSLFSMVKCSLALLPYLRSHTHSYPWISYPPTVNYFLDPAILSFCLVKPIVSGQNLYPPVLVYRCLGMNWLLWVIFMGNCTNFHMYWFYLFPC